jgi:hypothetical protein
LKAVLEKLLSFFNLSLELPVPQETDKAVEDEHVNNKDLNNADEALVKGARDVKVVVNEPAFQVSEATLEVKDEICSYETDNYVKAPAEKRTCSLELYPEDTETIDEFSKKVENYLREKTKIIGKVIACQVEHYGSRLKFVWLVSKRQWLG